MEKIDNEYEILEYKDPGPYQNSGKELITGIEIIFRNGIAFDYKLRRTSFGLPDYFEIDADGKTKLK